MRAFIATFLMVILTQADIVDTIFTKGYPKLDRGEIKFKSSIPYKYRLKDFNFKWNITFFTVVTFVNRGKEIYYKDISTLYKSDNRVYSKKEKKDIAYLANIFRKTKEYPFKNYNNYQVIIFIDNKGKMYAIENFKELKDMLGKIDTLAELKLWINLKYKHYNEYSAKLIKNIWRVRFTNFDMSECSYLELFRYYNKDGKYLKKQKEFYYKEKNCPKPIIAL